MNKSTNPFKSILYYTRSQRIGLLLFFLLILFVQAIYFFCDFKEKDTSNMKEEKIWLANQKSIDSIKQNANYRKDTIYPFNPNFITDFKGYKLGMSTTEIDRLLAYRRQNKFINSAKEFQEVTKVSNALLHKLEPYFKFSEKNDYSKFYSKKADNNIKSKTSIVRKDINNATNEDLMKIFGIGEKISERILKQKEKLGAFVSMDQMKDVWGLTPEVVEALNKNFFIKNTLGIKKVNINKSTIKELMLFPYFNYAIAKEIVIYRSMNKEIKKEDLYKIKGFPVDKIKFIALYLDF